MPVWLQAPRGVLPCAVPIGKVIARNEKAAIGVAGGLAYTTGFELTFYVFAPEAAPGLEPFDRRILAEGGLPPGLLRVGLEYSDGVKLTSTSPRRWPEEVEAGEEGAGPTMMPRRGSGWDNEWHRDFWCWPLPPPGPLQLVCEWPEMEIVLTRREIDAAPILDAASRAEEIFPQAE